MEIIPEIEEKIVVREKKRKQENLEEQDQEQEPTREVWSEDKEKTHRIQNTALIRPKLEHHVAMWNIWGEKFSGYVTQHHRKNKTQFKIKEDETQAELWTDLRKLNYWEYIDPPPKMETFFGQQVYQRYQQPLQKWTLGWN